MLSFQPGPGRWSPQVKEMRLFARSEEEGRLVMCIVERGVLDDLGLAEQRQETADYQVLYDHNRQLVQDILNEKFERGEGEPDGTIRVKPSDLIKRNVPGTKYPPGRDLP